MWLCSKHQESFGRITVLAADIADSGHAEAEEDDKALAQQIKAMKGSRRKYSD